jgi:tRNA-2-methylthio-N6-dimethylallyladenosine synthase
LGQVRRFLLRTYGCQMNVHDSEKVANLLHHHDWAPTDRLDDADLLIVNTCSIRDKAEQRLYADLGQLRAWKQARPARVVGVAGCVAQQQGDALLARFGQLDFVCGTHNLRHVPAMVEAARQGDRQARTDADASRARFDFPERHPDYAGCAPGRAFVTVMEGCDMFCSFCIVPLTRGRELSRAADDVLREVRELARRGVLEVTLLGQTVNAYGRHDARRSAARRQRGHEASPVATVPFAQLLRRIADVPGIERIRYTSPHPVFLDEDLVRAHAELPALCPHVHLPVQSGSDAVLARMRRRYTADDYRRRVESLRRARPDVAVTTDLIVGFPGESDADFRATLDLVRDVGFVDSFSFKYSPRPGTSALDLDGAVAPEVAQQRLEELQALQRGLTLAAHRARVGESVRVLMEGPSRRGGRQRTGRDPYHRVVNWVPADGSPAEPGRMVDLRIAEATPHSLIGEPPAERGQLKTSARRADETGRAAVSGG